MKPELYPATRFPNVTSVRKASDRLNQGKKRIPQFSDTGQVRISVSFAQGEHVRTIQGYAPAMPKVTRLHGVLGIISYDLVTRLFMINVGPAADLSATIQIGL